MKREDIRKDSYDELEQKCKKLSEQVRFYQEYDFLTGVYNKDTFNEKVKARLDADADGEFSIICIDVERFKLVNDLFGTEKGDELLRFIADRLNISCLAKDQLLARLTADVFAVCISGSFTVEHVLSEILAIFRECPIDMEVVPAVGIYRIDDKKLQVSLMCDRAIMALTSIKGKFKKYAAEYDHTLRNVLLEEQEIMVSAEAALADRQFVVYMQPKCNMHTGKVVGAEALVRWEHPQKGQIPPNDFIPIFEQNGFVRSLDTFVWEEVLRWQRAWIDGGHTPLPVSVNISRIDIFGMDVCSTLMGLLEQYQMKPEHLELEITESAYVNRSEEILDVVERLMDEGFVVSMDDFGSGYSSLNMLKDINVNTLKLDLRFLDNANKKSKDILESVIHMARWLNLKVIAEGVELAEQIEFLLGIGCEYAQGYYYYKPMPLEEYEKLLLDPDRVDYFDMSHMAEIKNNTIQLKELLHEDLISDQVMNHILGGVALYQFDGSVMRILRCNEEYYWLVHHENMPAKLSERNVLDDLDDDDRFQVVTALQKAKDVKDGGAEIRLRRLGGEGRQKWVSFRFYFLSEVNGDEVYYSSATDVSFMMGALEDLRMSELQFRVAMEEAVDVLFILDIETRIASYGEGTRERFGLEDSMTKAPEGFIEQDIVYLDDQQLFRDTYQAIFDGKEKASCVVRIKMGDGNFIKNRVTLKAIKNQKGKSVRAVGLVQQETLT